LTSPPDALPGKSTWSLIAVIATGVMLCLCGPGTFGLAAVITETVEDELGALSMIIGGAALIVLQLVLMALAGVGLLKREKLRWLSVGTFALGLVAILMLALTSVAAMTEFF
jgi:glucan phosphoethanolaminetransferase (alkaline phosphatase superfamily)